MSIDMDQLLASATENYESAKKQYQDAQNSKNTTLIQITKANFENTSNNLQNIQKQIQQRQTANQKMKEKRIEKIKQSVDPNAVKIPRTSFGGSEAVVYFPPEETEKMVSYAMSQPQTAQASVSSATQPTIKSNNKQEEKKTADFNPAPQSNKSSSPTSTEEKVTMTREEYRKMLKRQHH